MGIRIVLFFTAIFFGFVLLMKAIHFPVDGVLTFFFVLMPIVVLLFAHYRRIGHFRTLGLFDKALWHLRFWRILLPKEAYLQIRLSILAEAADRKVLRKAVEEADGLIASPFLFGFVAEMERRNGNPKKAESQLLLALEDTPPSILRTGILAQLSRLYILAFAHDKKRLQKAEEMLKEARTYVTEDAHKLLLDAIQGELLLARNQRQEAIALLEPTIRGLIDLNVKKTEGTSSLFGWLKGVGRMLIAQLTYSQRDEHQFPLFAEFLLSLGNAYKAQRQMDKAREAYVQGLSLCKQPFVLERLEKALSSLP